MSLLSKKVRKIGGSFEHTGTVVSEFKTTAGEDRIVLEFDPPTDGMLHIYRPDQVEVIKTELGHPRDFLIYVHRLATCPGCGKITCLCGQEKELLHEARRLIIGFKNTYGHNPFEW